MISFMSYTISTLEDWKRWLFNPIHRKQNRKSRIMNKQRNMFQVKEQDNSGGKETLININK